MELKQALKVVSNTVRLATPLVKPLAQSGGTS